MIEQSILKGLSGKAAPAPAPAAEGGAPAKATKVTPPPQDFAAIMLAQQDLEGELLGADIGKPVTAENGAQLPESGKLLPDAPQPDAPLSGATPPGAQGRETPADTPAPAGLAALAKLPELPSYRDIPILPPQQGHLFAKQARAPSLSPETAPQSTPAQAPTAEPAKAPAAPAPSPVRAGDVQMVVTQAPAFSATLEQQAAGVSSQPIAAREKSDTAPVPSAKSLLSLYGKTQEKTAPQSPSAPSPAPTITTAPSPAAAPAAPAPAQLAAPVQAQPPATPPALQSLESIVERLVQTRDSAAGSSARLSVANSDFGTVSLRFDNSAAGLSVSMTNADPEFAATARTALAERIVAAGEAARGDSGQTRSDSQGQSSSNGHSAAHSNTQSQNNGAPRQDNHRAENSTDTRPAAAAETRETQGGTDTGKPASSGLYI